MLDLQVILFTDNQPLRADLQNEWECVIGHATEVDQDTFVDPDRKLTGW